MFKSVRGLQLFLFYFTVFGLPLFFMSCSEEKKTKKETYINSCVLNEDQSSTLLGRWPVAPLQIAFHDASQFTSSEKDIVYEMATVWNKFFEANYGFSVFSFYNTDQPAYPYSCDGGKDSILFDSNGFKRPILIYKRRTGMTGLEDNIAITKVCQAAVRSGESLSWINSATIELNYEHYFSAGKEQADLRFTILHEFGHLLGLDHSCEISAVRADMPDCKTTTNSSYLKAVMFPSTAKSELRNLGENDQLRANCLYEEAFSK